MQKMLLNEQVVLSFSRRRYLVVDEQCVVGVQRTPSPGPPVAGDNESSGRVVTDAAVTDRPRPTLEDNMYTS